MFNKQVERQLSGVIQNCRRFAIFRRYFYGFHKSFGGPLRAISYQRNRVQ